MGHCPEWYTAAQAAKWLGVPVPDLPKLPIAWRDWGLMGANAEAAVRADEIRRLKASRGQR